MITIILIVDLTNSTYCLRAKNFLNPSMGFSFSNLGAMEDIEKRNPVCSDSIIKAVINVAKNKGAIANKKEYTVSFSKFPTTLSENTKGI